jgi:hypothetical protein
MISSPDDLKQAFYFGYGSGGHFLRFANGYRSSIDPQDDVPGFPWNISLLDTGLLKNGKHPDVYDGKVFWTCGGRSALWHAFFWWDNSGDKRGASNSGFYVRGFEIGDKQAAFDYACSIFPEIVARQKHQLVIQP